MLGSWTVYLSVRWQMCASSHGFRIWLLWILELLLAVPDLLSVLEFTLLSFPAPQRPSQKSDSGNGTITADATVHVFITYARAH
jgi:hypothetical protein